MIVGNFMLFIDGVLCVLFVSEDWVCVYNLFVFVYMICVDMVVVDFFSGMLEQNEGLLMVFVYVVLCML